MVGMCFIITLRKLQIFLYRYGGPDNIISLASRHLVGIKCISMFLPKYTVIKNINISNTKYSH
jgi:hypothetical protein